MMPRTWKVYKGDTIISGKQSINNTQQLVCMRIEIVFERGPVAGCKEINKRG